MLAHWGGSEPSKLHNYASLPTSDPDFLPRRMRDERLGELLGFDSAREPVVQTNVVKASPGSNRQIGSVHQVNDCSQQLEKKHTNGFQLECIHSGASLSPRISPRRQVSDASSNGIGRGESKHSQGVQSMASRFSMMSRGDHSPHTRCSTRIQVVNGDGDAVSAGLGKVYRLEGMRPIDHEKWSLNHHSHKTIGTLAATAICGNDITASCFYVVGELSSNAGIYGPVCSVLASLTLACFRGIYGEVVAALPLNGGIYNLLLNSATKRTASVAACLTILSYTATGVVSSVTAADYFLNCFALSSGLAVPVSVAVLAIFASLMLLGMKESSVVASALFLFHLFVLFMLVFLSLIYLHEKGVGQFRENMAWPHQPPVHRSIFFGFASAMLGVSGFETSANFVEEQKQGVFPKTLTNMWLSVSVINISLSFLAVAIMPLDVVTGEDSAYVLATLADQVAGPTMRSLVSADAVLVLSGSVLTSYVGVTGLILRMAGDRCLPEFFAAINSSRGTPHWAIIMFFCICASMCIILQGDISMLAAIYSLAFFLVMGLFAFCGLYMKVKRPTLPRPINTHPALFVMGLGLVSCAFLAVYVLHPDILDCFYVYYSITVLAVMLAFMRVPIYSSGLWFLSRSKCAQGIVGRLVHRDDVQAWILDEISRLWRQSVVYFTKHCNASQINRALQYIEENEEARCVRVVHIYGEDEQFPYDLVECVQLLDIVYPKIRMDCVLVRGEFGPAMIEHIANTLSVPVNCMFMNCPKEGFRFTFDELKGVRIILNSEKSSMLERCSVGGTKELVKRLRSSSKETVELQVME